MTAKPLILLVEDNPDDVFIFTRHFRKLAFDYPLQVVRDGVEALEYLRGQGSFSDREKFPLPRLVMLDLKLPLKHGLEVLTWMRAQPEFVKLPVVVLTSSAEQRDIARAQNLQASAYLVKPPTREIMRKLFTDLENAQERRLRFELEEDRLPKSPTPESF